MRLAGLAAAVLFGVVAAKATGALDATTGRVHGEQGCEGLPKDPRGQLIQTDLPVYVPDQLVRVERVRQPRPESWSDLEDLVFVEQRVGGEWRAIGFADGAAKEPERLRPMSALPFQIPPGESFSREMGSPIEFEFISPNVERHAEFRVCMRVGLDTPNPTATYSEFTMYTREELRRRFPTAPDPPSVTTP